MIEAKVTGIPDLRRELLAIPEKLRKRALRNALAAGARLVQREARRRTPLLKRTTASGAAALASGRRKVGTVQRAISVRTSKAERRAGNVGVFVNVRPAKKAQRGAKSPDDPFYWRWLEFGWAPAGRSGKPKPGAEFLQAGARMLPRALTVFTESIRKAFVKLNQRQTP